LYALRESGQVFFEVGVSTAKRRWFRRLRIILGSLIALLLILGVAGKFWIVPAVMRWEIQKHLSDYWDGTVRIDEVEFNFTSPIRLRGISLIDSERRPWAWVGSVEVTLEGWPGTHPVATQIDVDKVAFTAYCKDGKCRIPIRFPAERTPGRAAQYVDLHRLSVRGISASVVHDTGANGDLIREASADFLFTDKDETTTVSLDIKGSLCEGSIACNGVMVLQEDGADNPTYYQADLTAKNVNFAEFVRVLSGEKRFRSGEMAGRFDLRGEGTDPRDLRGEGAILLRGADLASSGAVGEFFESLAIDLGGLVGGMDLGSQFTVSGPLVQIRQARLVNNVSALDVEPGGTVNLESQQVDLHVVVAVLNDVKDLFAGLPIPLLNVSATLAHKLSRVHVKGRWSDPPVKLIRKEPIKDIQESTVELLRGAVSGGGKLTGGLLKPFDGLFHVLGGKNTRKSVRENSAP
jgi:hypothetical protein